GVPRRPPHPIPAHRRRAGGSPRWTLIFSKLETFVTSGEANRQPFVDVLGSDAEVFVAPLPGGGTLVTLTGDLNPNRSIATARA
ncbi:MAG: hypothetical protein AAFR57_10570, partial [Pseudomonadota bacterium]